MKQCNLADVTLTGVALFQYVTEASDLDFKPGEWPGLLATDLGNKQPLYRFRMIKYHDEFGGFIYRQQLGSYSSRWSNCHEQAHGSQEERGRQLLRLDRWRQAGGDLGRSRSSAGRV